MIALTFLLLMWAGTSAPSPGQPPVPRFEGRVLLRVSAPEPMQSTLMSCLTKGLRGLDGVTIVDRVPDYEISVLGVQLGLEGSAKTGCALSVTILRTVDVGALCEMLLASQPVSPERRAWAFPPDQPYYGSFDQLIKTGPSDSLAALCSQVIERFETSHLQPARKLRQRRSDARKQSPEKQPEK